MANDTERDTPQPDFKPGDRVLVESVIVEQSPSRVLMQIRLPCWFSNLEEPINTELIVSSESVHPSAVAAAPRCLCGSKIWVDGKFRSPNSPKHNPAHLTAAGNAILRSEDAHPVGAAVEVTDEMVERALAALFTAEADFTLCGEPERKSVRAALEAALSAKASPATQHNALIKSGTFADVGGKTVRIDTPAIRIDTPAASEAPADDLRELLNEFCCHDDCSQDAPCVPCRAADEIERLKRQPTITREQFEAVHAHICKRELRPTVSYLGEVADVLRRALAAAGITVGE